MLPLDLRSYDGAYSHSAATVLCSTDESQQRNIRALINESGHGEYDWAEFLLNVDTFQGSERVGYPARSE